MTLVELGIRGAVASYLRLCHSSAIKGNHLKSQIFYKGVTYELILNPIARALGETRKPLYGIEDPELVGLRHD